MFYTVKPEYMHMWGREVEDSTLITEDEVKRLSEEWCTSVEALLEELIPAPMRYWWVVDDAMSERGEVFTKLYLSKDAAMDAARSDWENLTETEKKNRNAFYVCYAAADEDGCLDYDTATDYEYIKEA